MKAQDANNIILYQDENGITRVSVRFVNDDVWLTQNQIAMVNRKTLAPNAKTTYADITTIEK